MYIWLILLLGTLFRSKYILLQHMSNLICTVHELTLFIISFYIAIVSKFLHMYVPKLSKIYMFFIEIKNHIMKINLLERICNVIHSPFSFLWTYHEPFKILYTICFVQFTHMEKKEYDIIYDVVDVVMITWRHCR